MDDKQDLDSYNEELRKILDPKSDGYVMNATISEARLIALARSMVKKSHPENEVVKGKNHFDEEDDDETKYVALGHIKHLLWWFIGFVMVVLIIAFAVFPAQMMKAADVVKSTAIGIFSSHGNSSNATQAAIQGANGEKEASDGDSLGILVFKQIEDIGNAIHFKVLRPFYLPEGYTFDKAETYKGSGKYLALFYSKPDGKQIVIIQTALDKNISKNFATGKYIEKAKVNGHDAVYKKSSSLVWNNNDVRCELTFNGLDRKEVFKIAESIK